MLAVHNAALDVYNIGLIVKATEMHNPKALVVAVGRSISGDAKRVASEKTISIGVYADASALIEAALVGQTEIKS